jgi:N-acetyl-gamma-glutamyl-phosphate reductase
VDPAAPAIPLEPPEAVDPARADVVFVCLPHGSSAATVQRCLEGDCRAIDLSGDLRIEDAATHAAVYDSPRPESLAREAVYGLTEFARDEVRQARVVANPGCYPTSACLALGPLMERDLLTDTPVVDAKSGVSGAGRTPTPTTHFCSASGDVRPYKVGRVHRHVAEIEQTLRRLHPAGHDTKVVFSPHLVPMDRGLLSTIVVREPGLTADTAREALRERYRSEPFVDLLAEGQEARVRAVAGTNRAAVSVHDVTGTDALIVICAIDNLIKGAAGQAIQNMNLMTGLEETAGLPGPRQASRSSAASTPEIQHP